MAVTTIVIDAGARYGKHPSWNGFNGELQYIAFEPDVDEASRLKETSSDLEVVPIALAGKKGERTLHITKHRGYCSFLETDLESEWFKRYRPGEGEVEKTVQIQTEVLDSYLAGRNLQADFLKVDTEGTELEILEGADKQIRESVLGIRTSAYFQACYKGQAMFEDIHDFLSKRGYFLLNLDYVGRGVPRNSFFRNPDPLGFDTGRYGTLIGTDGVWLRNGSSITGGIETLKYAYFAMLNFAPDVGIDTLLRYRVELGSHFDSELLETRLYRSLRRRCAEFLGRYRVYADHQWDEARHAFQTIFDIPLEGADKFWSQLRNL